MWEDPFNASREYKIVPACKMHVKMHAGSATISTALSSKTYPPVPRYIFEDIFRQCQLTVSYVQFAIGTPWQWLGVHDMGDQVFQRLIWIKNVHEQWFRYKYWIDKDKGSININTNVVSCIVSTVFPHVNIVQNLVDTKKSKVRYILKSISCFLVHIKILKQILNSS